MVQGFSAFILFMKPTETDGKAYFGELEGEKYPIRCDQAPYFYELWKRYSFDVEELVASLLSDAELWGTNLTELPGFHEAVLSTVQSMIAEKVDQ
jgi:tagaturonate reductase